MPEPETDLDAWLAQTLEDRRLSRGERQAFDVFLESVDSPKDLASIRDRIFAAARAAFSDPDDALVIEWLQDALKSLRDAAPATARQSLAEAYFSPGDDCLRAILRSLDRARNSADLCVFTITDDRLAEGIIAAHRRGVQIRILTDNEKAGDLGSDIERFDQSRIPIRVDSSPYHMHHKFAIFDASTLLTGSYNWTRGAARDNEENLILTDDPRLVGPFIDTFEGLWKRFE